MGPENQKKRLTSWRLLQPAQTHLILAGGGFSCGAGILRVHHQLQGTLLITTACRRVRHGVSEHFVLTQGQVSIQAAEGNFGSPWKGKAIFLLQFAGES